MFDVVVNLILDLGAGLIQHRGRFKQPRGKDYGATPPGQKDSPLTTRSRGDPPMPTHAVSKPGRRRDARDDVSVLRVGC
jgi:hypothetical protein